MSGAGAKCAAPQPVRPRLGSLTRGWRSIRGAPKRGEPYEKGQTMTAEIGAVAPDFALPTANNETISLAQFRGQKHVILSFHVFNFTSG
jgi:hypothetical protein